MSSQIVLTQEFKRALGLLHSGKNLFLTGKAGTGKSTLIRMFMQETDRNVVVAAPTGITALNVEGYTIHRLFSLHPTTTLADIRDGSYYQGRFAQTLKTLDTLIIDEASVVRADPFDQIATACCMASSGQPISDRPRTPDASQKAAILRILAYRA